ncbi:manganese catalase family protein [[Clostridium] symbiosum]|uniref:manganese catalase family protein n=1 Tax=Clostridium symbiosum TaxID=1512 RepID=UPI00232C7103|nr:manganese catalase family protein [[Clostridium] symbiosum]MDB2012565.1 manganese catalase family protein [[Clostridium] symbiosum]
MWKYEKRLQYPVKIKQSNPQMAQFIMSQYGGPDGEIGASMRYLSQRYSMPYKVGKGLLTDIGTEELAHMEIVAAIIHQLTRNLTPEQIKESGFGPYYIDHTTGIWPQAAGGIPFNACEFQSKGDPITDLFEDMAADGTTAYVQHRSVKEVLYNLVCQTPDFTELRNSNVFQSGHFLSLESVFLLIYNQLVFQRFLCLNVQDLCIAQ